MLPAGQSIPPFDDDPRCHFIIDEIACTTSANGVRTAEQKKCPRADCLKMRAEYMVSIEASEQKDSRSKRRARPTRR